MFTGIIQKIGTVKRVSRGAGLVVEIVFTPWTKPLEVGGRQRRLSYGSPM